VGSALLSVIKEAIQNIKDGKSPGVINVKADKIKAAGPE